MNHIYKSLLSGKNKKFLVLLMVIPLAFSCQERLEEMNMSPNSITEIPAEYLFTNAVRGTFRADMHSLHADFGGQYGHLAISEGWDRQTDSYEMGHLRGDVTGGIYNSVYKGPVKYCNDILKMTAPDGKFPNEVQYALVDIIAVMNFAKATDLFGDVPYFQAGLGKDGIFFPEYDEQKVIYEDMIRRLNEGIEVLKNADFSRAFPGADPIYDNDKDKWIRFANSFRLRLAMRARFVPETQDFYNGLITTCLSEPLIESNDQNATLQHWKSDKGELYNPWYDKYRQKYEKDEYEFNVSEFYVETLRAHKDPRLPVMVSKATLSEDFVEWLRITNDPRYEYVQNPDNTYLGMRNGLIEEEREGVAKIIVDGRTKNVLKWPRKDLSMYSEMVLAQDQYLYFMTAAEIWLLRAEAALFDLGPGDANAFYQMAIQMGMEQWGLNSEAISDYFTVSPEAELKGNTEEKFEQISTQMWLTFVPNNIEAWNNIRRTGYPVIKRRTSPELSKGMTDGVLPTRLYYPTQGELNINGENMQVAKDRMGITPQNELSVKVWWDIRD